MSGRARLRLLMVGCAVALGALAVVGLPSASAAYATPGASGVIDFASIDANTTAVSKVTDTPLTYRVTDNITISLGDTLFVLAGTELEFQNRTGLLVLGGLEIRGSSSMPVRMRVIPDSGGAIVGWTGITKIGSPGFVIDDAVIADSTDIALINATGGSVRNLTYQGRLILDDVSGALAENLVMTPTPSDAGRVPLWLVNCDGVRISRADLTAGTGWGGDGAHVETSQAILFEDLTVRTDNANLVGFEILGSTDIRVVNYTFAQGPGAGSPSQAVQVTDSDRVWFERIVIAHVGSPAVGTLYGQNSNATIANSTFPPGLLVGVWGPGGRLTGVNATRLPVRPDYGGEVREYELVRIEANWSSGGPLAAGSARVENASWNVTGAITGGGSPWLWLLRWWNNTASEAFSTGYTATVTCNCTAGSVSFIISDEEGTVRRVLVDDISPPVALVSVHVARTGEPGTLDASASFDNDGVAAYAWSGPTGNLTGLPCSLAVCPVTFFAPGVFVVLLMLTDSSGNSVETTVRVMIVDVLRPTVSITSLTPERPGQDEVFTVTATATDNDPAFLPAVEWHVDGARVAGDTLAATFHLPAVGIHTVRVVVKDDAGNAGEANRTFEVRDSTTPQVGAWVTPDHLEAPAQLTLNGSLASDNVAVVSWRWHIVGPGTDYNLTGAQPAASFPAAGAYNITLTATDAEGNQAERTYLLHVLEPPHGDRVPYLEIVAVLVGLAIVAVVIVALRRRKH